MSRDPKKIHGVRVWLILWKAYAALRAFAEEDIASLGLSMTDFGILEALLHKGPLPVNEIGAKISLTSGSMTVAVDRLQNRGLVDRQSSPGDRRARVVHLTAQGRKLIECAFARHAEAMEQVSECLTDAERTQLTRLLKKLGGTAYEKLGFHHESTLGTNQWK